MDDPASVDKSVASDWSRTRHALGGDAELFDDPIAGRLLDAILTGPAGGSCRDIPLRLRRYKIERLLGRGNFGLVFKAMGPPEVGEVAIKFPRSELLADADRLERFKQEVRIAATLQHPSIARFIEAEVSGPIPFLVSEFCKGVNLNDWASQNAHVKHQAQEAAEFIACIADAVQAAHERGVIHRDLKPSNILLRSDAHVRLSDANPAVIDFGMARLLDSDLVLSRSSLIIGTPLYMAPEQAECRQADVGPATDVFSLGAILYELLVGQPPYADVTYTAILDRLRTGLVAAPRRLRPDVPRDLDVVVMKCLEYRTQDRYASAAELADELRRIAQGKPILTRVPSRRKRLYRWSLRPERVADAMSIIIAFCGVRVFIAYFGSLLAYTTYEQDIPVYEMVELVILLTVLTVPIEFALMIGAAAQRRGRLPDILYWSLLAITLLSTAATAAISVGIISPPTWYQHNPAARLTMFQLISATFATQVLSWWIGDWRRVELRAGGRSRRWIKAAMTIATIIAVIFGFFLTH